MKIQIRFFLLLLLSISAVISQVAEYFQCGGIGYKGSTQCASGLVCRKNSDWFSMCVKSKVTQKPTVKPTTKRPIIPTNKPSNNLITEKEFNDALTTNGYSKPSLTQYNNLVSQASSKGNINTKLHLAMFLTHAMWESDGLKAMREYACYPTLGPNCAYGGSAGRNYYGRGYLQLSWDYNYRAASQSLYNSGTLITNPDQVASNDSIAWATAFWFWKTNVANANGVQNGNFGSTTNAINGALECRGAFQDKARIRFGLYKKVLVAFNLNTIPIESGCYN